MTAMEMLGQDMLGSIITTESAWAQLGSPILMVRQQMINQVMVSFLYPQMETLVAIGAYGPMMAMEVISGHVRGL